MHAELLILLVINVVSSLPLADVTMQLLQPPIQFTFRTVNASSCQTTLRCFLRFHMDRGWNWVWTLQVWASG